jgi:hypothetical protein
MRATLARGTHPRRFQKNGLLGSSDVSTLAHPSVRQCSLKPRNPKGRGRVSVQPEIWVERPATAVDFYERAFGARVLHRLAMARTSSPSSLSAKGVLGRLGGREHGAV